MPIDGSSVPAGPPAGDDPGRVVMSPPSRSIRRHRRWLALLAGVVVGVGGVSLCAGAVFAAETSLTGGQTREWCEGDKGYDGPNGPLERCVRERDDTNLLADDEHTIEFYREDSGGDRYEAHAWPLDGDDVRVEFGDDSVTVTTAGGMTATYPNSVFDDSR